MSASSSLVDRRPVSTVAIIGNDAVLAAAPATPVQVAHACLRRGFTIAVPVSWGDELIASEAVRRLAARGRGPAVMCVCPFVRARLLAPGPDLAPFLVSLVSPPVATARYVRAAYGEHGVHITYIGACPGADDPAIDACLTPDAFLADIAEHGIALAEQPLVFDSIVPPDRRRWFSLPGGTPSAEVLWSNDDTRTLVEIDQEEIATDLAQHLIARENVLLDLAPGLGCACSGAIGSIGARHARAAVTAVEPPRALGPVVDPAPAVALSAPVTGTATDVDPPDVEMASSLTPRRSPDRLADERVSVSLGAGEDSGVEVRAIAIESTLVADFAAPDESADVREFRESEGVVAESLAVDPTLGSRGSETTRTEHAVEIEIPVSLDVDSAVTAAGADTRDERDHASPPVVLTTYAAHAEIWDTVLTLEPEVDRPAAPNATALPTTPLRSDRSTVRRRTPLPMSLRHSGMTLPKTVSSDGKALPRAYVAKRRTPSSGTTPVSETPQISTAAPTPPPREARSMSDAPPELAATRNTVVESVAPTQIAREHTTDSHRLTQSNAFSESPAASVQPEPAPVRSATDRSSRSDASPNARATTNVESNPSALVVLLLALIALGFLVLRSLG